MSIRLRALALTLVGVVLSFSGLTAWAQSPLPLGTPMLILDSPAKTAYLVDANDPTHVAAVPFPDAPALLKGTFRQVSRTPTTVLYAVTVADGAGHLLTRGMEFNLDGASAPPTGTISTLTVSNSAVNFSATCDGKYLVVCGAWPTPVSVVDVATGTEVNTIALANNVVNVVCASNDNSVLAVEIDSFGGGTGIRRLTIDDNGVLTDTTELLSLPGAYSVIHVPGTGFGVALSKTSMTDNATAFTLAGMTSNGAVDIAAEDAESLAFSCGGTNLIVRSRIMGGPIEAASVVESFAYDSNSGTITSPATFSFTVGAPGDESRPGGNLVNISPDGSLIAASEQGRVRLYSATDGSFVREFVPASLNAGDITFLSCCQLINVNPPIEEQVIAGPDVNGDMAIDTEIPVKGTAASPYTFRIDLHLTTQIPTIVIEQIGPAWDVLSIAPDVPTDPLFKFPPAFGWLFGWPTYVIWVPSGNNGSLTIATSNRRHLFPATYLPDAAGPVPQTRGAKVYYPNFTPVLDDFGNPVVGTAYSVNAFIPGGRPR